MYNYNRLKGRIVECFGTQGRFAAEVGRSNSHISKVLNGKTYLDQKEIDSWCETLEIEPGDIGAYFFAH